MLRKNRCWLKSREGMADMDCAEHRNNDMAHCPQCLAMYWKAQYEALKADMTQRQVGITPEQLRFKSACEISGEKHPEYVRGYEAAMGAVCRAREQQPTPDVTMKVMEALATILRKAQGRIDTETSECIDIGAECMAIRREFDRISKEDRLLEALERIANMDSMSYHSLESAKITARAALGAAPQAQPAPTNKEHDNAKDAD